jgi:hypothetical protein
MIKSSSTLNGFSRLSRDFSGAIGELSSISGSFSGRSVNFSGCWPNFPGSLAKLSSHYNSLYGIAGEPDRITGETPAAAINFRKTHSEPANYPHPALGHPLSSDSPRCRAVAAGGIGAG